MGGNRGQSTCPAFALGDDGSSSSGLCGSLAKAADRLPYAG